MLVRMGYVDPRGAQSHNKRTDQRSEPKSTTSAVQNVTLRMEGQMIVGYARVSTDGQTLDAATISVAGCRL